MIPLSRPWLKLKIKRLVGSAGSLILLYSANASAPSLGAEAQLAKEKTANISTEILKNDFMFLRIDFSFCFLLPKKANQLWYKIPKLQSVSTIPSAKIIQYPTSWGNNLHNGLQLSTLFWRNLIHSTQKLQRSNLKNTPKNPILSSVSTVCCNFATLLF